MHRDAGGQRDEVRKEQGESDEHGVSVKWVQGAALREPYEWM